MPYTSARGDVGDRVDEVLRTWLPSRLAPAGVTAFDVSEFSAPPAGYSGKTAFFTVTWIDAAGGQHAEDLGAWVGNGFVGSAGGFVLDGGIGRRFVGLVV